MDKSDMKGRQMNLEKMETELRNPDTMNIDHCSTMEIVSLINQEDHKVADAVKTQLKQIADMIDAISEKLKKGGRLIYMGAGTSGRLGVLDAAECMPTYGVPEGMVIGLIAGGEKAMFKAQEGAEDSEELGRNDLIRLNLNENDSVVGLAASGRTPYVIGGLKYGRECGSFTGSVSCVSHAAVSSYADVAVEAVTGPEVITGSTRMKAGTAEKMICNMISTGCMIRYGKVYQNLMVDVQPTNDKLVERSKHIISDSTGCSLEKAALLLEQSGMSVKKAILMEIAGCDAARASELLKQANGNVRGAIVKAEENHG